MNFEQIGFNYDWCIVMQLYSGQYDVIKFPIFKGGFVFKIIYVKLFRFSTEKTPTISGVVYAKAKCLI
jgi:hypothetical protein